MALSREQIEQRKAANREILDRAAGGGGDDSRILNLTKDVKHAHVDVLLVPAPGLGFVTFNQHWFVERTYVKGRDGADDRWGSFMRTFVCPQSSEWHFRSRVDKKFPSPPSCPVEKLIAYIADRPELHAQELFRFGEDCSDKSGRPLEPRIVTGADFIGRGEGPLAYQRSLTAQEKTLFLVIPVTSRIDGKEQSYDPGYRFVVESFSLVKVHSREYGEAVAEFGEDVAGNFSAPAVFRWTYDARERGAPGSRWSARFLENASRNLPREFVELWEADVPESVAAEVKAIAVPGDPENIGRALHGAFCGEFDLGAVSGLAAGDVFDEEIAKREERKPKEAPPANGERAVRAVRPVKPPQARRVEPPPGLPCGACGKPCAEDATKCPHCGASFADADEAADGIPWD